MKLTLKRSARVAASISFLLVPVIAWHYRFTVYDWVRLRNYSAPASVAQLATDDTMTSQARHLFYVYHPSLEGRNTFSQHCTNDSEKTIVLGCYVSSIGIYLYDVQDARLHGVEQVTAAHEMLHAAYERLSVHEKQYVNSLTAQAFAGLKDDRIRKNIEQYRDKDPGVVPNELHSILGTEVRTLPPALENYYKRYFTNRAQIVSFSEQYEQAFTDRQARVAADDVALKNLKSQIDTLDSSLKSQSQALSAEHDRLNALLSSGRIAAYNSAVPDYNNRVNNYNTDVATERSLIDRYNALVTERNNLALEENQLIKAIDSRPSALQTQ